MIRGLLADHNAEGHLAAIVAVCRSPAWREVWNAVGPPTFGFADLGLDVDTADDVLWNFCQREQLLFLTNNRNDEGGHSLESAIRNGNTLDSLPVLTIADPNRVRADRRYAERIAVRLMELLIDIDRTRGAGRLYLP